MPFVERIFILAPLYNSTISNLQKAPISAAKTVSAVFVPVEGHGLVGFTAKTSTWKICLLESSKYLVKDGFEDCRDKS